ncbi:MAG: mechanosensitive ion channel family protein [Proteobacteria bacterium]|nr:mechanosensitive ion channel family protein [Pseudomonadota bacterium]
MNPFISNILTQLKIIFNPNTMGEQLAQLLTNFIIGGIVMIVFYCGWLIISVALRIIFKRSQTNEMTKTFMLTLCKYAMLIIGIITALDSMGIKVSAVLASLGIAGLTIGFAARDSLSNIIAGVLIFLDRPFVIGDLVEIENYYGRVDKITLRSTRVVTSDGKMLAVPNTEIINKTVASYTNFPNLRIDIKITIGVNENINRVRKILLALIDTKHGYLDNPPPRVIVTGLNDYNIPIELQAWLADERKHVEKRFELREKAFNALTEAGVDMPFETFSLSPLKILNA